MFWDNLSGPSSRVKQSKKKFFFYIVVPSDFTLADVYTFAGLHDVRHLK
jgi:hypothetical protein